MLSGCNCYICLEWCSFKTQISVCYAISVYQLLLINSSISFFPSPDVSSLKRRALIRFFPGILTAIAWTLSALGFLKLYCFCFFFLFFFSIPLWNPVYFLNFSVLFFCIDSDYFWKRAHHSTCTSRLFSVSTILEIKSKSEYEIWCIGENLVAYVLPNAW